MHVIFTCSGELMSIENHNIIRFNLGGIKSKMSNGSKYKNSPTWKSGSKQ